MPINKARLYVSTAKFFFRSVSRDCAIPTKTGGLQQRFRGTTSILLIAGISRRDASPVLTNCRGDQPDTLDDGEGKHEVGRKESQIPQERQPEYNRRPSMNNPGSYRRG